MGVAQALNVVNKAIAGPAVLYDMMKVAMSVWVGPSPRSRTRTRIAKTASKRGTARMRG
jgi:hypothetical protein